MSRLLISLSIITIIFTGCSDDEEFDTSCGVVTKGELRRPAKDGDAIGVTVTRVVDSNLVAVEEDNGRAWLVSLHALSNDMNDNRRNRSIAFLDALPDRVNFFPADDECRITLANGGEGIPGQLITTDDRNYSEELLKAGLGKVDENQQCGSELIANCYLAILAGSGADIDIDDEDDFRPAE